MHSKHLLLAFAIMMGSSAANARTVDAGSVWLSAGVGPGIKMGGRLGGSAAHLSVSAQGEYVITQNIGTLLELNVGLAGTIPFRVRPGVKYRITQFDLPLIPYAQAQLSVGRLFDVLGANLTYLGVRAGVGADYLLTADLSVGGLLATDIGTSLGARPAYYGTFDILVLLSYAIF